ncbi:MAG TPA: lysylphosphatidylglycerol synthase domain-containing protein [Gaiellaceae bacterium]|nr:lysylphosphatidylglycerol synthase domain-containing protein [Gaiellaceae bacterium]
MSEGRRGEEIFGLDRRRRLVTVAVALVLAAGAFALIGDAADFGELAEAVRQAETVWLPVCLAGLVLAYAGYILAYRDFARVLGGPRFSYRTVARIVGVGFGANLVGSGAGGFAVDFWAVKRAGLGLHDAARRVLGLNTLEWAVLGGLAAGAAAAVLAGGGEAPRAMTLGWLAGVPACAVAAAWVSSPRRAERFTEAPDVPRPGPGSGLRDWLRWLLGKLRKGLADAIGGVVVVRALVSAPSHHPAGVLGFPVYWAGNLLTLYAALRAFGVELGLAPLVLAFATGYVASGLPLPGGGSGGIEAAITFALHAVGVPLAPALLAAALYRVFTFWLPVGPALLLLPTVPSLHEELPRTPRGEPGPA